LTDLEIYHKTMFLSNDDEMLGCYFKGHCDIEQWRRVATDYLKTECGWEPVPEEYQSVKKGYYKVVPYADGLIYHFSDEKMRGSFSVMEMQYL
jgi:hypothetical protein